jgi:hypothetical protein
MLTTAMKITKGSDKLNMSFRTPSVFAFWYPVPVCMLRTFTFKEEGEAFTKGNDVNVVLS